jgi:hypothetical protein
MSLEDRSGFHCEQLAIAHSHSTHETTHKRVKREKKKKEFHEKKSKAPNKIRQVKCR